MNVRDYLKWVYTTAISNFQHLTWAHNNVYYRGQGNCEWELKPSLFRHNGMLEYDLLHNAINVAWQEITSATSYLEKIILLQHYGLPTRLLDITMNPLVALYFACQEEKDDQGREKDGIVYSGYIAADNYLDIETICSTIFQNEPCPAYERKIGEFELDNPIFSSMCSNAHIVRPPLNSNRLIAQDGAFIMAPLLENDHGIWRFNTAEINRSEYFPYSKRIPARYKVSIKKELMTYGIHEGSLFPDLEHKLKSVSRKYFNITK